ncbi:hypothetical protein RUND412_003464 [Rhizina undulata]
MEVSRGHFDEILPEIIEAIQNSTFVTFDLELSGIFRGSARPENRGRKQTLQERYQEVKESAEKFQIVQFGLCTVHVNKESGVYICRPFNFYVSPVTDQKFGLDREYSVQAGSMEFLAENGFNFNAQFTTGVPYLSHDEEKWILEREDRLSTRVKEDIYIDESSKQFVEDFVKELQDWVDDPNPPYDFLNITTAGQNINGYQKRLVHQIVRAKFPNLTSLGKPTFVQIVKADPAAEEMRRKERRERFDRDLQRAIGLRHIVDAIFKANPVLVGHNLFTDLINLYYGFIGVLPETVEEFATLIHKNFPIVIDTKFVATCDGDSGNLSSSLQTLWETLGVQRYPSIELHHSHHGYLTTGQAHEAGYDSYNTARILIKLIGRYCANLEFSDKQEPEKKKRAREALMKHLDGRRYEPYTTSSTKEPPEFMLIPDFGFEPIWGDFVNRLRVNGTMEGECLLV